MAGSGNPNEIIVSADTQISATEILPHQVLAVGGNELGRMQSLMYQMDCVRLGELSEAEALIEMQAECDDAAPVDAEEASLEDLRFEQLYIEVAAGRVPVALPVDIDDEAA